VLFSEPKIPQSNPSMSIETPVPSFSALQRAENSSMGWRTSAAVRRLPFQCSSASRKFLNPVGGALRRLKRCGFSALQRAENSSMKYRYLAQIAPELFQCSSASRKFLNSSLWSPGLRAN